MDRACTSSGGIHDNHEGRYVREAVAMRVAAVVIDSFGPRGVRSTVQGQTAVTSQDFNRDALAAPKALGTYPRLDRSRIGIVGFSKGGTLHARRQRRPNQRAKKSMEDLKGCLRRYPVRS
jgi:dienelactone hydrolase